VHLSSRQIKILKWVGYPVIALLTFVFTLSYTFPYDRLKDKIVEQLSDKYDVSIMSMEPSLIPGTFVIKTMVLRTRPTTPEEKPVIVLIDEVEVNVGVISAVFWTIDMAKISVEINAQIAGGSLHVEAKHEKGSNTISLAAHTKMLPIASMPGVREAVGLPMTGGLSADLDLTLPQGKWAKSSGSVKLSCIGCTVGDGVAKMKMKPPPGGANNRRMRNRNLFAGDGLTVPRLNLGAVLGEISIKNGTGVIETFAAKSQDGFLRMEGKIEFKDPFKESVFPGCMKFGFSDDLKERSPKFMGIEAGLPPKAKQGDGSYAIPTKGKLVELRFDVRRQCGQSAGGNSGRNKNRKRPQISASDGDSGKTVAPRKMPSLPKPDLSAKKDAGPGDKETSTASGPRLGKGIRDIKERAEALSTNKEGGNVRDEDESGEDDAEDHADEDIEDESGDDDDDDDDDSSASEDEPEEDE